MELARSAICRSATDTEFVFGRGALGCSRNRLRISEACTRFDDVVDLARRESHQELRFLGKEQDRMAGRLYSGRRGCLPGTTGRYFRRLARHPALSNTGGRSRLRLWHPAFVARRPHHAMCASHVAHSYASIFVCWIRLPSYRSAGSRFSTTRSTHDPIEHLRKSSHSTPARIRSFRQMLERQSAALHDVRLRQLGDKWHGSRPLWV